MVDNEDADIERLWRDMVATRNVVHLRDPQREHFAKVAKAENVKERKKDLLAGVLLLAGMLVWFGVGVLLCAYLLTLLGKEIFG